MPGDDAFSDASKRNAKRDSLFLLADIRKEGGARLGKARVRNLSESGLMADFETGLADGDRLVVDLRGIGEVSGTVTWVLGGRIGMAFDVQIEPQNARKPLQASSDSMPSYLRPIVAPKTSFRP